MSSAQPISNVPYRTFHHKDLTIEGYSRALVHSCWRIPELNIGFDVGTLPWEFLNTPRWFISHGHIDHLAALPVLVSRRNILDFPEPTSIYVPAVILDDVRQLLSIWEKLDLGSQKCQLIGLNPDEEVGLSTRHLMTTFATSHTVPSLGYIVWERRQKLKEEFTSLSSDEIRKLRLDGVEVTHEVKIPLVCYSGDTSPRGLDACAAAFEAKILIVEMTVLKPEVSRERIHEFGHMHILDFVERAERFQNEQIIACHISSRYTIDEAEDYLQSTLPYHLRKKIFLWT